MILNILTDLKKTPYVHLVGATCSVYKINIKN